MSVFFPSFFRFSELSCVYDFPPAVWLFAGRV